MSSIQLAVAWQGDRLMMIMVLLLGNIKHSPGTVLSPLQIGDLAHFIDEETDS